VASSCRQFTPATDAYSWTLGNEGFDWLISSRPRRCEQFHCDGPPASRLIRVRQGRRGDPGQPVGSFCPPGTGSEPRRARGRLGWVLGAAPGRSAPGTNLPISNVRFNGEYRRQSGQHVLNASPSHFDHCGPRQDWRVRRAATSPTNVNRTLLIHRKVVIR
jgi:hypothetical protein